MSNYSHPSNTGPKTGPQGHTSGLTGSTTAVSAAEENGTQDQSRCYLQVQTSNLDPGSSPISEKTFRWWASKAQGSVRTDAPPSDPQVDKFLGEFDQSDEPTVTAKMKESLRSLLLTGNGGEKGVPRLPGLAGVYVGQQGQGQYDGEMYLIHGWQLACAKPDDTARETVISSQAADGSDGGA